MLKNYMEVLVSDILNEIIDKYNVCKCEECIDDIKAIALNNLPPKYFLSSQQEGEKKAFVLDRQRRISVLAKVAEAIEFISNKSNNNPCK
jgi:competence protein ComFB